MRFASEKTLRGSRSTRMSYAKCAIDRTDEEGAKANSSVSITDWSTASVLKEFWPLIPPEDMIKWALKERDYRAAFKCHVDLVCFCGTPYTTTALAISKNQGIACSKSCAQTLRPSRKRTAAPGFHLTLTCACGKSYNTTKTLVANGWGIACSKSCAGKITRKLPRKKRASS